jgi:hypothetical protein
MESRMPNSVSTYFSIGRFLAVAALIAPIGFVSVTMFSTAGWAQTQANTADAADSGATLSDEQLDELVGPIALYPDELLAITMPASTFPLEIVQAARYLEQRESKPDLKPNESWDSSVLGLLNYPDVIEKMNQDLDWTSQLGDAVVNQQQDLMDAVQRFRAQANAAGNLNSDEKVTIAQEQEIITIESVSTEVIYVPAYNPTVVIVHQPVPYTYVYSRPYPYYYSPAATFWTGMFVGAAVGYGIGWNGHGNNDININRNVNISGNTINRGSGNTWKSNRPSGSQVGRPATRSGTRPGATSRSGSGSRSAAQPKRNVSKQQNTRRSTTGGSSQVKRQKSSGGSFGNYQNGRSAKKHSDRGRQSRAGKSNYRTSKSSHKRSSGGRSRRR